MSPRYDDPDERWRDLSFPIGVGLLIAAGSLAVLLIAAYGLDWLGLP